MITHLLFSVFVLFLFASLLTNLLQLNLQPPRLPAPRPPRSKPRLRLTENGTFNVAIFSDLHYGEDEYSFGPEQDRKSTEVMAKLLGYEKPDFVVISRFMRLTHCLYMSSFPFRCPRLSTHVIPPSILPTFALFPCPRGCIDRLRRKLYYCRRTIF